MNEPKVAIVVPVYNVEKYIAECLESCINQSLREIEIIVVDDCGSDNSMAIASEFAEKDSRIKIVQNAENAGPMICRTQGVEVTTAPYIMFVDSDDFLALNACEVALNAAQEASADIVSFGFSRFGGDGEICELNYALDNATFASTEAFVAHFAAQKAPALSIWGRLMRRERYLEALRNVPERKITMAEDALVCFFLLQRCTRFVNLAERLYYYRHNPSSSTINPANLAQNAENLRFVIDYLKHAQGTKALKKAFLKSLENNLIIYDYEARKAAGSVTLGYKLKRLPRKLATSLKKRLKVFS